MRLYYIPGSCSLSPHIVAREADISIELCKVDVVSKVIQGGGDFNRLNGKRYVPALELDTGEVLTEGPAIVQYLADLKPGTGLAPPQGSFERYRLQEWLNFISSELHKSFSTLYNPKCTADWKATAQDNISRRLVWASEQLMGRPYLLGNRFTVADAYMFTVINWVSYVGIEIDRLPTLVDYHARIAARPKVKAAMVAEGLVGEV